MGVKKKKETQVTSLTVCHRDLETLKCKWFLTCLSLFEVANGWFISGTPYHRMFRLLEFNHCMFFTFSFGYKMVFLNICLQSKFSWVLFVYKYLNFIEHITKINSYLYIVKSLKKFLFCYVLYSLGWCGREKSSFFAVALCTTHWWSVTDPLC